MKIVQIISLLLFMLAVNGLYSVGSFVDNLDGTINDSTTGLIWQKCNAGQTYSSGCTGTAVSTMNWTDALAYCGNLALDDGGWRLPSMNELVSIIDFSRTTPAIHTYFPVPISNHWYWSSTTVVNPASLESAWTVTYYRAGSTMMMNKNTVSLVYVRCVK